MDTSTRHLHRLGLLVLLALVALPAGAIIGQDATTPRPQPGADRTVQNRVFGLTRSETPRILVAGWGRRASLELENRGSLTWSQADGFAVAYAWLTRDGERVEQGRALLPHPVGPGQRVSVEVRLEPPDKAGVYTLRWDVVQEKVQWFSDAMDHPKFERIAVVLPKVSYCLALLLPTALAVAAFFLLLRVRERNPNSAIYGLATFGVVIWSVVSILMKPQFLYAEMNLAVRSESLWMNLAVAAALLLFLGYLSPRWRPPTAWSLAVMTAVMVWAQILHFRFFRDVISVTSLMGAGQAGQLGEVIRFLARPRDLVLILDLLVALPLVWLNAKQIPPRWRPNRGLRLTATMILLSVVTVGVGKMWQLSDWTDRGRGPRTRTIRTVKRYGLYGFQARDSLTQVRQRWFRPKLSDQKQSEIAQWFLDRSAQRAGEGPLAGAARGMNLLAIQVESAQQFIVDLEIEGQEITPNLNRWRRRGIWFPRVQDQTGNGRSSAGEFVTWTSIVPVASSVAHEYPSNQFTTLAHALEREGYQTLAAVPFIRSFWNRHQTYPAYGFSKNLFARDFEPGQRVGWGKLSDQDFFRQMAPRLMDLPQPFCAWLTTLSLHYPYDRFPTRIRELDLGALENTPLGNYLHGMHLFDQAFGELMSGLEIEGMLDNTVVALWGDHDSGLVRRQDSPEVLEVSQKWPEFHVRDRVPFMIWLPGAERVVRGVETTAGQVDIAPTLMALFGIDPAQFAFMGRNLLNDVAKTAPVVHPNGNWMTDSLMFLDTGEGLEQGACWNLRRKRKVAVNRCREGYVEAQNQLEIAEAVLIYDLQKRLSERLSP